MDYQVALGRIRAAQEVAVLDEQLRAEHPDTFAGIYWADGLVLVVRFIGDVPDIELQGITNIGVTVRVEPAEYSAVDLAGRAHDTTLALSALGVKDFVVGTDQMAQAVFATISDGTLSPDTKAALGTLVQQLDEAGVLVNLDNGPASESLNALGGTELWETFNLICTTGFTVVSGSTTRISTAGHCPHPVGTYYWDPCPGVQHSHSATYVSGHIGPWGDFEWFTTVTNEVDDFYHTPGGAIRDVSGVMNSMNVGQVLAWYGRKTKTEYFGTVGWVGIADAGVGNLVCMNQGNGDRGDSGGPVYSEGLAAGLISKKLLINGAWRLCFSQARFIDDAIGVSIKTS